MEWAEYLLSDHHADGVDYNEEFEGSYRQIYDEVAGMEDFQSQSSQ